MVVFKNRSYHFNKEQRDLWRRQGHEPVELAIVNMKEKFRTWGYEDFSVIVVDALHNPASRPESEAFRAQANVLLGEITRLTKDRDPVAADTFKKVRSELESLRLSQKVSLVISLVGLAGGVGFAIAGSVIAAGAGAAATAASSMADDAVIAGAQVASKIPASAIVNYASSAASGLVSVTATAAGLIKTKVHGTETTACSSAATDVAAGGTGDEACTHHVPVKY
jgi:hypothetical protein